jgi:hypothetical protein
VLEHEREGGRIVHESAGLSGQEGHVLGIDAVDLVETVDEQLENLGRT